MSNPSFKFNSVYYFVDAITDMTNKNKANPYNTKYVDKVFKNINLGREGVRLKRQSRRFESRRWQSFFSQIGNKQLQGSSAKPIETRSHQFHQLEVDRVVIYLFFFLNYIIIDRPFIQIYR
jgi:hypothetical protein